MLRPLSVQLYSLRDYAKDDFVAVLKKVAEIGYKGVEPAGFWNLRPIRTEENRRRPRKEDLFLPLPVGERKQSR